MRSRRKAGGGKRSNKSAAKVALQLISYLPQDCDRVLVGLWEMAFCRGLRHCLRFGWVEYLGRGRGNMQVLVQCRASASQFPNGLPFKILIRRWDKMAPPSERGQCHSLAANGCSLGTRMQ